LRIAGLVRANTHEYIPDMTPAELQKSNARVARQIAGILETASNRIGAKVVLLPMHTVWLGGDDRIFNRKVADCFINLDTVRIERRYLSLDTLLKLLQSTDTAVVMRYHGHLFSMALGIPFLSINYTGSRSKIESLVSCIGYEQWVENWRHIDEPRANSRLRQLIDERGQWSTHLQRHADQLVHQLQQTYARVFNLPRSNL
jgi:polysaccharide pyruvyl transferase WcaK-like protein